jgi:phage-related holin
MNQHQDHSLSILIVASSFVFNYLSIDKEKFTILAVLMALDLLAGGYKAWKFNRFSMIAMRNGFIAKVFFLLIPIAIALMAKGLELDIRWIVFQTIAMLIVADGYSVIANIYSASTLREVAEIDIVSAMLQFIRKAFEIVVKDK